MSLFSVSLPVKESIDIDAPVSDVFPLVLDFKKVVDWSPWFIMEPDCKTSLKGDGLSVGSVHTWNGEWIGKGDMTHKEIIENKKVVEEVRFMSPWSSTAKAWFDFEDLGNNKTRVTWSMAGTLPLPLFWMKKSMIAWIGMDYQRGLSMLKELAEEDNVHSKVEFLGNDMADGFDYIGIKRSTTTDEMPKLMGADFERLESLIKSKSLKVKNPAFSIYHKFDPISGQCAYTAGVALQEIIKAPDGFIVNSVKGGKALRVKHTGRYLHLGNAWTAGMSYIRGKKIKARKSADPIEVYLNHPKMVKPEALETVIYFPVQ